MFVFFEEVNRQLKNHKRQTKKQNISIIKIFMKTTKWMNYWRNSVLPFHYFWRQKKKSEKFQQTLSTVIDSAFCVRGDFVCFRLFELFFVYVLFLRVEKHQQPKTKKKFCVCRVPTHFGASGFSNSFFILFFLSTLICVRQKEKRQTLRLRFGPKPKPTEVQGRNHPRKYKKRNWRDSCFFVSLWILFGTFSPPELLLLFFGV